LSFAVSFTRTAEQDLISTMEYLTEMLKSPIAAGSLVGEFEKQVQLLSKNPFINQIEEDGYLNQKMIRHIQMKNYLMFYTINESQKDVSILRFIHARRNWVKFLFKE
jgi:toxin ParE1/3/4